MANCSCWNNRPQPAGTFPKSHRSVIGPACIREQKGSSTTLSRQALSLDATPAWISRKTVIGDALPGYLVHCSRPVRSKISVVRAIWSSKVFCATHPIPHEDCSHCLATVKAMRPTIFAELAAAELRSGTDCCHGCDFIYYEIVDTCPQCGTPHPFFVEQQVETCRSAVAKERQSQPVADLESLTFRNLA